MKTLNIKSWLILFILAASSTMADEAPSLKLQDIIEASPESWSWKSLPTPLLLSENQDSLFYSLIREAPTTPIQFVLDIPQREDKIFNQWAPFISAALKSGATHLRYHNKQIFAYQSDEEKEIFNHDLSQKLLLYALMAAGGLKIIFHGIQKIKSASCRDFLARVSPPKKPESFWKRNLKVRRGLIFLILLGGLQVGVIDPKVEARERAFESKQNLAHLFQSWDLFQDIRPLISIDPAAAIEAEELLEQMISITQQSKGNTLATLNSPDGLLSALYKIPTVEEALQKWSRFSDQEEASLANSGSYSEALHQIPLLSSDPELWAYRAWRKKNFYSLPILLAKPEFSSLLEAERSLYTESAKSISFGDFEILKDEQSEDIKLLYDRLQKEIVDHHSFFNIAKRKDSTQQRESKSQRRSGAPARPWVLVQAKTEMESSFSHSSPQNLTWYRWMMVEYYLWDLHKNLFQTNFLSSEGPDRMTIIENNMEDLANDHLLNIVKSTPQDKIIKLERMRSSALGLSEAEAIFLQKESPPLNPQWKSALPLTP